MAIINKIRQRSGIAIGVIAVGLILFVVGGEILNPNSALLGGGQQSVGSIYGEDISYSEFESELRELQMNYELSAGRPPNDAELNNLREQAWNNLIFKYAFEKEFDELGITITNEELIQMVQGDSMFIHPQVRFIPIFNNQETQRFDPQLVVAYFQQLDALPEPNKTQQKLAWKNFEGQLQRDKLRTRYENLMVSSTYVTTAEAKREYNNRNTTAELEYLYVPYTSIADSTLKVTDEQLETYLEENRSRYEDRMQTTRSFEYVAFEISPSSEDSTEFATDIRKMAKQLAVAKDDSAFAIINSDQNTVPYQFTSIDKLPIEFFKENPTLVKDGVYGPFVQKNNYKIFKVADIEEDSIEYVRASHILITWASDSEEDKAKAREKANNVLDEIKGGASFEELAKEYNTDATKETGGDLGFFSKGRMVKPFEKAVFAKEGMGVIERVIETEFGYHIIKVTHPRTKNMYKLAVVDKTLEPSQNTYDEAYKKAEELLSSSNSYEEFKVNVEKNPSLFLKKAEFLPTSSRQFNEITEGREIVRWAFNDAEVGDISPIFEIPEQNIYLIATLTSETEKEELNIESFRDELTLMLRKDMKAESIIQKLNASKGDLKSIAKSFGNTAVVNKIPDLSLASPTFGTLGYNPVAVGTTFGIKEGTQTKAFADETGVFIIKTIKFKPASEIADYSQYQNELKQGKASQTSFLMSEAVKKDAEIEDNRYKFY